MSNRKFYKNLPPKKNETLHNGKKILRKISLLNTCIRRGRIGRFVYTFWHFVN